MAVFTERAAQGDCCVNELMTHAIEIINTEGDVRKQFKSSKPVILPCIAIWLRDVHISRVFCLGPGTCDLSIIPPELYLLRQTPRLIPRVSYCSQGRQPTEQLHMLKNRLEAALFQ